MGPSNKSEPRLFRLEAAFTLAVMHYGRQERMKCEEVYHHAVSIGKKTLSAKEARKEERCIQKLNNDEKTMKELMEGVLNDCMKNLSQLNASTGGRGAESVFSPMENPTRGGHYMPIGRGGTALTSEMFDNLIDVGGNRCDFCKETGKKMFKCSGCNKGFYCSKDCQKRQWRERDHKRYCRKDGQFEPGDLVQCARLKNRPEINGRIMRVVGRNESSIEERYKLQMEGAIEGDNILSLKPENLNQLRPYDCRI